MPTRDDPEWLYESTTLVVPEGTSDEPFPNVSSFYALLLSIHLIIYPSGTGWGPVPLWRGRRLYVVRYDTVLASVSPVARSTRIPPLRTSSRRNFLRLCVSSAYPMPGSPAVCHIRRRYGGPKHTDHTMREFGIGETIAV